MYTVRALQCLVAAVDHGSVTAAADALGITQPALSHQLAALDREAGVTLVDRSRRGVRPTPAGRGVLEHARACVDAERRFAAAVARAVTLDAGELRLACAQSLTAGLLPPVLRRWRRERRDVRVSITEHDSADKIAASVADGEADVGVAPRPSRWAGRLDAVGTEEMVVVAAADDPLARRAAVRTTDLVTRPLVHYADGSALARWVDAMFTADGVDVTAAVRTSQTTAAAMLAETGVGPAVVPASAVPPRFAGMVRPMSPRRGRDIVALRVGDDDILGAAFVADLVAVGVPRPTRARRVTPG